jgi:hypothetical protein
LSSEKAKFLNGRYVNASLDVDDLAETKEILEKNELVLALQGKLVLSNFPEVDWLMDVLSSANTLGAVKAKQCKDQEKYNKNIKRSTSSSLLIKIFECKAAFKAWRLSDTHKDDSGVISFRGSR